jgi:hypothetical protein
MRLATTLVVTPGVDGVAPVRTQTSVWAVPWRALVLVVVVLGYLVWRFRRRRKARRRPDAAGPSTPADPSDAAGAGSGGDVAAGAPVG